MCLLPGSRGLDSCYYFIPGFGVGFLGGDGGGEYLCLSKYTCVCACVHLCARVHMLAHVCAHADDVARQRYKTLQQIRTSCPE